MVAIYEYESIDFHEVILLYSITFSIIYLSFICYLVNSSENCNDTSPVFSICMIFFPCLTIYKIIIMRICSTMLNICGNNGHLCVFPDSFGNVSRDSLLSIMPVFGLK